MCDEMTDGILNLAIFVITVILLVCFARKDGTWVPERLRKAFRFFTVQSNVLCAVTALLTGIAAFSGTVPEWVWILKYIGTVSVTVTMLTVFFFLGPSIGKGWVQALLKGPDLFMHFLTPLAALISFCVFEKRGMNFSQSLWGLISIVLYGPLYLYKTVYAPEEKRWDDFYGFNKNGKWPISFLAMLIGTILICLGLMALQNC